MRVEVVTVFAPRPDHPKWMDYLPGMRLQKRTAEKFGCRQVVVTDAELDGFDTIKVDLPKSLMKAILVGQIAYLEQWDDSHCVMLIDADCLLARDPLSAFTNHGEYDLGLTWRADPRCMINNGAMYAMAGSKRRVLSFFRHALSMCGDHWGGDQESISMAAQPDPQDEWGKGERLGCVVQFLPMRHFNCTPGRDGAKVLDPPPYVVHFKGEHRKAWMATYAEKHILI